MEKSFQKIIQTSIELFTKLGVKRVTMDEIARECMISKKTLYKYVNDKIDLINQVINFESKKLSKKFFAISEKGLNAVEEVFELHRNLIKLMKSHNHTVEYDLRKYYPSIQRDVSERRAKQVYQMMVMNLKKGIEEGLYYDDIDIELIAKQRVIFQVQRIENSIVSYKEFTNPYAMKQMFIYHLRAICSPKGMEILNEKIKELFNDEE